MCWAVYITKHSILFNSTIFALWDFYGEQRLFTEVVITCHVCLHPPGGSLPWRNNAKTFPQIPSDHIFVMSETDEYFRTMAQYVSVVCASHCVTNSLNNTCMKAWWKVLIWFTVHISMLQLLNNQYFTQCCAIMAWVGWKGVGLKY